MKNENMNESIDGNIQIKKRIKYLKIKNLVSIIIFIFIAMISGAVAGKYVVNETLEGYTLEQLMSNHKGIIGILQKQFSEGINNAALSLVTISNDTSNLNRYSAINNNVTGVVIDKDGYIITSYSKIKDYNQIFVKLPSLASKPIKGKIVGGDENTDIGLIKVEGVNLIPIKFAKTNSYKEGDFVISLGNAIADNFLGIAIPGLINSTNEVVNDSSSNNNYNLIQSSAMINEENNGGVLCNIYGELVGFNSTKLVKSYPNVELYYSVGVEGVLEISKYLIGTTDVLGINGGKIINDEKSGVKGVYIISVIQGGYAEKSGIKPTDIIISLNNKEISTPDDIYSVVKDKKSGDTIKCVILRDGQEMSLDITLE